MQYAEDEISLPELLYKLYQYGWVFIAIVPLSLIGGYFYYAQQPETYVYTTPIEIGTYGHRNGYSQLESVGSARAKLSQIYITVSSDVTVELPRGSQLIMLRSTGPREQERTFRELHLQIANRLIEDHQRFVAAVKANDNFRPMTDTRALSTMTSLSPIKSMPFIFAGFGFVGLVLSGLVIMTSVLIRSVLIYARQQKL